jgi:hypothetical protein
VRKLREREREREMGRLAVDGGVRDEEFVGGGGGGGAASCKELKSDMAAPWIDMENLDVASDRFFQKPGINAFGQAFRFTCIPSQVAKLGIVIILWSFQAHGHAS